MPSARPPLSPVDAAWLRMDHPTNLMMIVAVLMFESPLDRERLARLLQERFLTIRRFRQRVSYRTGTPCWEDDPDFDLAAHLAPIVLPEPADQAVLQAFVSTLMSTPLDAERPLWHMYLVENYGHGSALVVRIHHAIADGIALVQVLLSLTDVSPDASIPATPAATSQAKPTLLQQSWGVVTATARLLRLQPDARTRLKDPLGVPKQAAWSPPLPLPEVKRIGRRLGATVNDVLVTTVAGAIRRYLLSHDQEVATIEMRAVIPVNLRPLEQAWKLGNRFGIVFLPLPVRLAHLPERLAAVRRRMERLKGSMEALVSFGILGLIGMAPAWVRHKAIGRFSATASLVLTNVPGPQHRLFFASAPLAGLMFWVPRAGTIGTGLSIISYHDQVFVGIATDQGHVPDPDVLVAAFVEEFEALKNLHPDPPAPT
jgi:NRPS condensation-like uncharacterized protein